MDTKRSSWKAAISHRYSLTDSRQNVFAAKYSPDGQLIVSSYADGTLHFHKASDGKHLYSFKVPPLDKPKLAEVDVELGKKLDEEEAVHENAISIDADHAITSIAWKPIQEDSGHLINCGQGPQSFRAATSDGRVFRWSSSKPDEFSEDIYSQTNYFHCIDYSHDGGEKFAVAGMEPVVEIYDEATLKRVDFFDKVDRIGHCNKIYCLKFDNRHPSVLYSGGWDRNVVVWDIRQGGKHCGVIYGPLISGEAIDIDSKHHLMVTGSLHEQEGVQMWDLRTLKLIRNAQWSQSGDPKELSSIYSVSLMKPTKDAIIACGTKRNCAKLISVQTGEVICDFTETMPSLEEHPLTIVDSSPLGRVALMANSIGQVHVKNILVAGIPDEDDDGEDSDMSPMFTPKRTVYHAHGAGATQGKQ